MFPSEAQVRKVVLCCSTLACVVHPRATGRSSAPLKDVPVVVGIATGATSAAAVGTAVVVTTATAVAVGTYYDPGSGGGLEEHARATCQKECKTRKYTGFKCGGDKSVTWFN